MNLRGIWLRITEIETKQSFSVIRISSSDQFRYMPKLSNVSGHEQINADSHATNIRLKILLIRMIVKVRNRPW